MSAICCAHSDREPAKDASVLNQSVETKSSPPRARFTAVFGPPIDEEEDESPTPPCVSFKDEPLAKDKARRKPPIHVRLRWRKAAIWVTVACIIVSLVFTITSSVTSAKYGSDSAMANAFDCFLALCTSLVVLWRFRDEQNGKLGLKRERCCTLVFGVSFIFCGMLTAGTAIAHIAERERPDKNTSLIIVLSIASITYALLGAAQLHISNKLRSSGMLASAIDSGLSATLIFGLLFSDLIYNTAKNDLWYLDHAMALGVAVVTALCGIKMLVDLLVYKKLPIEML